MKIVLPDKTYIYSYNSAYEWLTKQGFDKDDIEDLQTILLEDYQGDGYLTYEELEDLCNERERLMDVYYCSLRDMGQEISELCGKLAAGKGGTKAQMAEKILNVIEFYGV